MFSFLLSIYLGVSSLGHRIVLCLICFYNIYIYIFTSPVSILSHPQPHKISISQKLSHGA